jgi:hypothetical protein
MTTRKRISTPKRIKLDFECIADSAVKRLAKQDVRIRQIRELESKFRILDESGEIPDRVAAIQQFMRAIDGVFVQTFTSLKRYKGDKKSAHKRIQISTIPAGKRPMSIKKRKPSIRKRPPLRKTI